MRKSGVLLTLIRIPFHGKEEELLKLIQQMDGPIQKEDLLKLTEEILVIKTSMKKFGDSSMQTRTLFHGKEEELLKLIHQMDGPIQLEDSALVKRLILPNQRLKPTFTISSTRRLNPCHGSEMTHNIQPMEVLSTDGEMDIHHFHNNQSKTLHKETLQTKKLDQMFGLLLTRTSNQLLTGDQTSHQPSETSSHTRELHQFQSSPTQAGKKQSQMLRKRYKLNSLVTQKELTSWTQSPTKPEPTETLLTVASKSEEPLSTERFD